MRKKFLAVVSVMVLGTSLVVSTACSSGHEHNYSSSWDYDSENHWHESDCDFLDCDLLSTVSGFTAHTLVNGTCSVCGYEVVDTTHVHTYASAWSGDSENHWHESNCTDATCNLQDTVSDLAPHNFVSGVCACGAQEAQSPAGHVHNYVSTWSGDDMKHWHVSACSDATCQYKNSVADLNAHTFVGGACSVCGYPEPASVPTGHVHNYATTWSGDSENHWHESACADSTCELQGTVSGLAPHSYVGGVCACGAQEAVAQAGLAYAQIGEGYVVTGVGAVTGASIVIPDSYNGLPVTGIASKAFYNNGVITSVTFGANVEEVGADAFYRCVNLREISFNNALTTICENAFYGCVKVQNVALSVNVETVEDGAFAHCIELSEFSVNSNLKKFGESVLYGCDQIAYNAGADGLKYLGNGENDGILLVGTENTSIASATIKAGTKVIAGDAFMDCASLATVSLPDGLVGIGDFAFYGCEALQTVAIPDSVESIGDNAFYGDTQLATLTFGKGVKSVGADAFQNCTALTTVTYTGSADEWAVIDFAQQYANPLCYATTLQIAGADVTSVTLNGATEVADYAFFNYAKLASVTLGDQIKTIGAYAFYGCNQITTVSLPAGIERVCASAFTGCSALTYTEEGNGRYLGNSANPYLVLVGVTDRTITSFTINAATEVIGDEAFIGCSEIPTITVPAAVRVIGNRAFDFCGTDTFFIVMANSEGWSVDGIEISSVDMNEFGVATYYIKVLYAYDGVWVRSV